VSTPQDRTGTERVAQGLTAALERMAAELAATRADLEAARKASEDRDEALRRYGRKNRRLVVTTLASLAVDVVLTVALALFAVQAHHVAVSSRNLCLSVNAARAQQLGLWSYLISISRKPATADDRARVAEFEQHLRVVFAPRDCNNVKPGSP
jgi:hypothetical protein